MSVLFGFWLYKKRHGAAWTTWASSGCLRLDLKDSSGAHYGWQLPFAVSGGSLALKPMRSGKPWVMNHESLKVQICEQGCVMMCATICALFALCCPRVQFVPALLSDFLLHATLDTANLSCTVQLISGDLTSDESWLQTGSWTQHAETKCAALADISQTWPSSLTHNPHSEYVRTNAHTVSF